MKCEICGEKAMWRFSPDLDVEGIGACQIHKESVRLAYYILCDEGEKEYDIYIKWLRREYKIVTL
jgi:hypothetical protein